MGRRSHSQESSFPELQLAEKRAKRQFGIDINESFRLWLTDMVGEERAMELTQLRPDYDRKPGLDFDLTDRERDVLTLAAAGLTAKEVGKELWISYHTVKTHWKVIARKLGTKSITHSVVIAILAGELDNDLLKKHLDL